MDAAAVIERRIILLLLSDVHQLVACLDDTATAVDISTTTVVTIITGNDNIYPIIIIVDLSAADRLTRRPARNRYNILNCFCIILYYHSILPVSRVCNNGTTTADDGRSTFVRHNFN